MAGGRELLSPHTACRRVAEATCGWLQRFSNACTYVRRCLLDGRACASLGHLQVYPRSLGRVHIGIVVSVPTSWLILWVQTDFASYRRRTTHSRGAFGFDDNAELKGSGGGRELLSPHTARRRLAEATCGWLQRFSILHVRLLHVRAKMSPRRASMRLAWAPSGVSEVTRSSAYRNRGLRAHVMVDLVGADRLCKPPQAHNAFSRWFSASTTTRN